MKQNPHPTNHPHPQNTIENDLTPGELTAIIKRLWENSVLNRFKLCKKPGIQVKQKLGIIPWHHETDRATSTCLHRLRSGHTFLNSFAHRIDSGADPSCRHGCPAIKNTSHILVECPFSDTLRQKIKSYCHAENIPFNLHTILSLISPLAQKDNSKFPASLPPSLSNQGSGTLPRATPASLTNCQDCNKSINGD